MSVVVRYFFALEYITVEYELTDYGYSLKPVIEALGKWGKSYRQNILKG
jgi:DNA-binding HxlR family transcriptional regulator